jgi:hypothetical protein
MVEFMGLFLEGISIYRAMVEEGFIKSETNTSALMRGML